MVFTKVAKSPPQVPLGGQSGWGRNPGCGLVSGDQPSHGEERPGLGWGWGAGDPLSAFRQAGQGALS